MTSDNFLDYYFEEYFVEQHKPPKGFQAENFEFPEMYAKESIDGATIHTLVESISKDTLSDSGGSNFIVLTEDERQAIIENLNLKIDMQFHKAVKVFSDDSLKKMLPGDDFLSWQKFRGNKHRCLYTFSRPILLRNNSLCFFYSGERCGDLCCGGEFRIYKKTKKGWGPFVRL